MATRQAGNANEPRVQTEPAARLTCQSLEGLTDLMMRQTR